MSQLPLGTFLRNRPVQLPQICRDGSPQALLKNVEPPFGLLDGGRLGAPNFIGLPRGHDLPEQAMHNIILGGTTGGAAPGVEVVEQLGDAALLVLEAAAEDLRGVRGEHDLH